MVKGVFLGFSGPESIRNAEGVRRKVTTGNKGGAKGFQHRTAYCGVLWVRFELFIDGRGYLEYLAVRRLHRLKLFYTMHSIGHTMRHKNINRTEEDIKNF